MNYLKNLDFNYQLLNIKEYLEKYTEKNPYIEYKKDNNYNEVNKSKQFLKNQNS